jgi:heat shock protein HtpX
MEMPHSEPLVFHIPTEVTPSRFGDLLDFLYRNYLISAHVSITNLMRWTVDGKEHLAFTLHGPEGRWRVGVDVAAGDPIEVKMTSTETTPPDFLIRLRESLLISIQVFEDEMRKTTFYFVWVPDQKNTSMRTSTRRRKALSRIFTGNMLFLFLLFLALSYAAFFLLTEILRMPIQYFPLTLVIVQLLMILFSHKIVKRMGDFPLTESSPYVHILQYNLPAWQFEEIVRRDQRGRLLEVKRRIYSRTLGIGRPLDVEAAREAFQECGIQAKPESMTIKSVNVYGIVQEASRRFGIPTPKIMLSNTSVPNAAATGPSPRFSLLLITTGLLIQLSEEEILSVIGHELSHIKRRDPLALFFVSSAEYLLRIYFFWQILYFFGLFYLFFALGLVYFIAKFFESRADLDSAIMIGSPRLLADALRKIGHRRIRLERLLPNRIGSWLGWNPHPPVSFRVERLEKIRNPEEIRHPFLKSVKDCLDGLLESL